MSAHVGDEVRQGVVLLGSQGISDLYHETLGERKGNAKFVQVALTAVYSFGSIRHNWCFTFTRLSRDPFVRLLGPFAHKKV